MGSMSADVSLRRYLRITLHVAYQGVAAGSHSRRDDSKATEAAPAVPGNSRLLYIMKDV